MEEQGKVIARASHLGGLENCVFLEALARSNEETR